MNKQTDHRRFCIAPLDVIKIRLQLQALSRSQAQSPPVYRSTLSTVRNILTHEGITGFWKGNVPAEFLYLGYGAVQFTTYRLSSSLLSSSPYPIPYTATSLISGSLAGLTSTLLTYPLDLLRTRFAAQGAQKVYHGLGWAIKEIYQKEGPRGYFRGLNAGLSSVVPNMGLFFMFYEGLYPLVGIVYSSLSPPQPTPNTNTTVSTLLPSTASATTALLSSLLSKTTIFPLDLVRKRLQVQGPTRHLYAHGPTLPEYREGLGIGGTVRMILREEGVRGLYRGLGISLVKAAPTSAVTMWVYEGVMGWMRRGEKEKEREVK